MFKRISSKEDGNLFRAMMNNKLPTTLFILWIRSFLSGGDPRKMEILADMIIAHDSKDIGMFDHIHHWLTGFILKSLSQSRNLPPEERKAKIMRDLSMLTNKRKTTRFIRGHRNVR